jgi:uncharacterized protein (TIGR03118 family)
MRFSKSSVLGVLAALALMGSFARADYLQQNLVSDIQGLAANYDPNLQNPWGVSYAPTGPFWVSDNNNSKSTLYNGAGSPISLVVSIPTTGSAGPTGQVWNGNSADFLLNNGKAASFLFANENGTISAWNGGTTAQLVVTANGASYTGIAIASVSGNNQLYAADAAGNKIDVYNSSFGAVSLGANAFQDAKLTGAGFSVFNAQAIGGDIYVTYFNSSNPASGGGAVAVFDLAGNLIRDFSNGPGGPLEDPWGVTLAPASFGQFGNALLVGNKEQGTINAFDASTGALLGTVGTIQNTVAGSTDAGLWGLTFGNGGSGGATNTLYAFAGINDENDGLIVAITSVPEPGSMVLMGMGGVALAAFAHRQRSRRGQN